MKKQTKKIPLYIPELKCYVMVDENKSVKQIREKLIGAKEFRDKLSHKSITQ